MIIFQHQEARNLTNGGGNCAGGEEIPGHDKAKGSLL